MSRPTPESHDTLRTRTLLKGSLELVSPSSRERAAARLEELRGDQDWIRRYFAGDQDAQGEYDLLVWQAQHGDAPFCCDLLEPMSAADLDAFYQRKYDGSIPQECRDAVEAARRAEREARS